MLNILRAGLRREIQRVAQDYDYDWKGQLEDLEDISGAGVQRQENSGDQRALKSSASSQTSMTTPGTKSDEAGKTGEFVTLSDGTSSAQDAPSIDIDATIDEAVELEEQTRLEQKRRRRGKGSKGDISKDENMAKKFPGRRDGDD
jgi:hypothetical protein